MISFLARTTGIIAGAIGGLFALVLIFTAILEVGTR